MKILFTCSEVHRGVDWQTAVLRGEPLGENIAYSSLTVPVTKEWFDSFVEGGVYEVAIEEKRRPAGARIQFVAAAVGHVENPEVKNEVHVEANRDEPPGPDNGGENGSEAESAEPKRKPPASHPPSKGHEKPGQVLKKR